jgi:pimeloyl-ACP methyl ester carboxylesterase
MGHSMLSRILHWALVALATIAILVASALGYRAFRQYENAQALTIDTRKGIQETMYVRLGGVEQWIQIRGDDRANPVLLFVHGGPGSTISPVSSVLRPWEKFFTVVMWDQRDAGKTFVRNGPVMMSLDRVAQDGIELSDFLRRHLGKRKIIVLGHSWGTMVGLTMVRRRPDLFSAYVGTGQVVSIAEKEPIDYARTMVRLSAAHDTDGILRLKAVGPPPYRTADELMVERSLSTQHDIPAERDLLRNMIAIAAFEPGWSLWDLWSGLQAPKFAEAATFAADATYDARRLGTDYPLPFFIITGAEDQITPSDLARRYFDTIRAPKKEFVVLPGAGHDAVLTEPEIFLRTLIKDVRPAAEHATASAA